MNWSRGKATDLFLAFTWNDDHDDFMLDGFMVDGKENIGARKIGRIYECPAQYQYLIYTVYGNPTAGSLHFFSSYVQ